MVDLTDPVAREVAKESLARAPSEAGKHWIGLESFGTRQHQRRSFLTAALLLGLVLVSPWLSVRLFRTSPFAIGLLVLLGTAGWVALRAWLKSRVRGRLPFGLAIASEPPRPPSRRRVRFRGRVRALRTLEAPISFERCVGFRLVGSTFGGEVDDAAALAFDLEVDDEEHPVRVEAGTATLDVPVDHAPTPTVVGDGLEEFLARRGLFPKRGPVTLAEGVLRPGALVEVTGVAHEEARPDNYRQNTPLLVLRDDPTEPLRIRALG